MDGKEELEEFGIETAKNTSIYVGAQLVSSLISFVVLIIAARALGPTNFGVFIIAIAFETLLGFGGNLSFGSALRRMLPLSLKDKKRVRSLLCNAYFVGSMSGLTIAVIAFIFSGTIATAVYHNPQLSAPLHIASVMILLTVLFNLGLSSLVGLGKVKAAATSDLMYSSAQLVAVALLLYAGYGISGAVAGMLVGFLVGVATEAFYLRKAIGSISSKLSKSVMKQILGFSLPVFASDISTMGLTNFAVLLLGVYVATSIVGNYGAAFKLGAAFQVVTDSTAFILLSAFSVALGKSKLSAHMKGIFANSVYYAFLFVLPMLAYLVASAKPFTYLFFSNKYSLAPQYFVVIAIGITIDALEAYAGNLMLAYGRTGVYVRYQLAAIAISLAIMLALTPYFGVIGVLIPLFVISPVLLGVMYCLSLKRNFKMTLHYKKLAAIACSAFLTTLFAVLLPSVLHYSGSMALIVNFLIVVLVYPPLSSLFRGITEDNIIFLRKFSSRLGLASKLMGMLLAYAALFVR